MVGDAETGEDEAGGQLGGRLLDGQHIAAEALVEIAVETMLPPRAVSNFINQRPLVPCGLVESLERSHEDVVEVDPVVGVVGPEGDRDLHGVDEGVALGEALRLRDCFSGSSANASVSAVGASQIESCRTISGICIRSISISGIGKCLKIRTPPPNKRSLRGERAATPSPHADPRERQRERSRQQAARRPPRRPGRAESVGRRVSARQGRARRSAPRGRGTEHDRSGAYRKR